MHCALTHYASTPGSEHWNRRSRNDGEPGKASGFESVGRRVQDLNRILPLRPGFSVPLSEGTGFFLTAACQRVVGWPRGTHGRSSEPQETRPAVTFRRFLPSAGSFGAFPWSPEDSRPGSVGVLSLFGKILLLSCAETDVESDMQGILPPFLLWGRLALGESLLNPED